MTIKTNYFDSTSYSSLDAIAPFSALLSNGVYNVNGGGLLVTANSPADLSVNVAAGSATVNGYFVISDSSVNVSIPANTSGYNRIDNIVINVDVTNKVSTIIVVQGTPSSSPVAPAILSNQMVLAEILVGNNASVINSNVITDKRVDVDLFYPVINKFKDSNISNLGSEISPSGLIRQWGTFYLSSGLGSGNIKPNIIFPFIFPNEIFNVFISTSVDDTETPNINTPTVDRPSVAVNGFNIRLYRENAALGGNIYWWAEGR